MLSKAKIKYIKSLQIKKFRRLHQEFLVEGAKSVLELLNSTFTISLLVVTESFLKQYEREIKNSGAELIIVSESELNDLGSFSSNNAALAVAKTKENKELSINPEELILVLDEVKDPGNLGTIIRIADWYGIKKICCSEETAEFYNPKVISSSMGSFTRIEIYYTVLEAFLKSQTGATVYGALLEGTNIHQMKALRPSGFLIMGNESNGIHPNLIPYITHKVSIPRRGPAESLNVAIATAVLCDNILR